MVSVFLCIVDNGKTRMKLALPECVIRNLILLNPELSVTIQGHEEVKLSKCD